MSASDFDKLNPYKSPAESSAPIDLSDPELQVALKNFHTQIIALGASWMIIGGICACCFLVPVPGEGPSSFIVAILFRSVAIWGLVAFVIGVFICLKKLLAVYVGLAFMLFTVVVNILPSPMCAIVLTVIGTLQAFLAVRVVRWAARLRAAGISLKTKPEDLQSIVSQPH